jgi:hypothetical protein
LLSATLIVAALALAGCGGSDHTATSAITLPPLGAGATTSPRAGASTTTSVAGATTAPTTTAKGATTSTAKAGVTTTVAGGASGSSGSSGGSSSGAKTAPDPCTLVTKAQAEALAGTALEGGITSGLSGDQSCTYPGAPNGPTAQVELFVGGGAKGYYDADKTLEHQFAPIPGLGDEAYVEDYNVFARKGSIWIALRLSRTSDFAPYRQPMIDLSTTIIKSL